VEEGLKLFQEFVHRAQGNHEIRELHERVNHG
jgi:hypothetical protein